MSKTICPNCHQTTFHAPHTPAHHFVGSREDEVAYIHEETRRLEKLIAQLHNERATLLRRLNAIQSRTITLPVETLSSIFEHACPPEDFSEHHGFPRYSEKDFMEVQEGRRFQLVVGAVSSHWRQVARSSPRLWTSITLDIGTYAEKSAKLLRLFIENSKTIPFALALHFFSDNPTTPFLVHESIHDLVIETLPRIRKLYLFRPPRRWHTYLPHLTRLSECSFDLSRPAIYPPDEQVILPHGAPLRRLSLQEALWRTDADFQLPWLTITSLTLSVIPPDLSVQVFLQCPNLIEFHCTLPSVRPAPSKPVTLVSPITFQYLEILDWDSDPSPWSYALARNLHTPALRELRWFSRLDPTEGRLEAFFNRLPPTLTKLELFGTPSHINYIRDDSTIEHLSLTYCSAQEVLALFQRLRPRWQDLRMVKVFPRLKELIIGEGDSDLEYLPAAYSIAVQDMLVGRLDEHNNSFHLLFETTEVEWLSGVKARLRELKHAGFDLRVLEEFEDVPWLYLP